MLVSRWSISFKLIAAFALVIAVFVAIAALVFFNLGNINRTSILRERSESEITRVDEVSKAMLDMAGLTRGFLLTRDPFFTKRIDKDYGQALDVMGDLGAKADSDDQRASFQAMETAVRGFKSEIVDPQIQLASGPATVDQLVGLMKADAKKKWVAAFRAAEAQFMQREEAIQAARTLDRNRAVAQAQWAIVGGAAFALVVAAALASLLYREIGVPVVAMTAAMKRLASGDLTVIVPAVGRGDEVGQMAGAVQTFKDGAVEKVRLAEEAARIRDVAEAERGRNAAATAEAARELAVVVDALGSAMTRLSGGDLTCRVDQAFSADYQRLRMDFNATVEKLQQTMIVIAASSHEINAGAENVSQTADSLARRTEQQAAGLEQTAAALDQITATVQRSATGAAKARTVVAEARSDAEHSGKVVRDAVTAMGEIEASSRQISQIIGVIDEIAFQTNLLALNAGVEAARAGDAGRGFAVVASEVRGLAQRAAVAAKEIKQLISASTRQVGAGVSLVSQTGEALRAIIAQVAQIDEVVGQIAASAQEEAVALNQISAAMNQMDQVTQQNAAMVEEATAASHLLDNEANRLNDLIDQFKTDRQAGGRGAWDARAA